MSHPTNDMDIFPIFICAINQATFTSGVTWIILYDLAAQEGFFHIQGVNTT